MALRTSVRGDTDAALREEVAWGCRILAYFGHNDLTLGHVSARRRGGDAMLMKGKGVALDEVTPANVVPIDFRGPSARGLPTPSTSRGPSRSPFAWHASIYYDGRNLMGSVTAPRMAAAHALPRARDHD
jgi:ribulose-5-phosphate 4-epimerase/fuculose-1-phosphate aldolase